MFKKKRKHPLTVSLGSLSWKCPPSTWPSCLVHASHRAEVLGRLYHPSPPQHPHSRSSHQPQSLGLACPIPAPSPLGQRGPEVCDLHPRAARGDAGSVGHCPGLLPFPAPDQHPLTDQIHCRTHSSTVGSTLGDLKLKQCFTACVSQSNPATTVGLSGGREQPGITRLPNTDWLPLMSQGAQKGSSPRHCPTGPPALG